MMTVVLNLCERDYYRDCGTLRNFLHATVPHEKSILISTLNQEALQIEVVLRD